MKINKYLSNVLKQFCQSITYLQRDPNSLYVISPVLSLSNKSREDCYKISCQPQNILLIIMLMVLMLNSVLLPLTRAAWSSSGVMEPDLLASTRSK